MSVQALSELLGNITSTLPEEEFALALWNRNYPMGSEVLLDIISSKIKSIPGSNAYLRLTAETIRDLNDKDVIDALIYFLDEYYPSLIAQISEDDAQSDLALVVIKGMIQVVRDADNQ